MSAPENPPAFPVVAEGGENSRYVAEVHPGMSLRDYFAGQALAGILSVHEVLATGAANTVAGSAYEYADAMLAARVPR